jgi:ketosteroid isomerase-like protein
MRLSRMPNTLAVAGALLVACSSENAGAPPPAPVDWHAFDVPHGPVVVPPGPTAKERAIAEQYAAILASADLKSLASLLAGDVHLSFPGMPDGRGKEGVVNAHETLFGAFDRRKMVITRLWRTDSAQAIEWTVSGVQTAEWMGATATNKPVAFKGLTVLVTKDDGTISDVHIYFDVAVVKAQLGLGPRELAALPPAAPPGGAPQVFEANRDAAEDRDMAAARATIDALEKNDEGAYVATMTEDVVVETLERAQPMRGRDEQRAYFRAVHRAIGMLDTTTDNTWGITRYAVAEYSIAGEQLAALGWVAAQRDKVIRLQVVDVMEIRDGKVSHVWRYDNLSQIAMPGP